MLAAALLLVANAVVPLLFGDVYPFTSAPMFRDAPVVCSNYRVFVDGQEQPANGWLLHRIYDGNPVGYGVGVAPPLVLEQEYGDIPPEADIRRHMLLQLTQPEHQHVHRVEVRQEVLGALGQTVGTIAANRWTIERP